ncbi:hypothetical protein [Clostridium gasigenes]|uniref:Uncharacterized protein n=1 Tax=Clostridium gasigenes TaxID=94869 RepID=A0A1H0TWE7_9CLOT|nr:hypothetical protein [Clostridium gasigenes]MBB6624284.1 hypothetical protein [Clostridium gasigenes]MBU3089261.1 hypothetical protein [Clostridium gasigenes]SDP58055.1 hypothetical protein SAMN04488529_10882 [Clostridium gasigenes]
MFNKKFAISMFIIILLGIVGFIRINIINTKALSPIGNTEDNYALVSEEFGEDFTEFIKDNADVKIYTGEGEEDASIRIKEKELRLKKENPFIKVVITAGTKIENAFLSGKAKIDNKIKDINKNNTEKENTNKELDSKVDDFIKSRGENKNGIEEQGNEETKGEENLETDKDKEAIIDQKNAPIEESIKQEDSQN